MPQKKKPPALTARVTGLGRGHLRLENALAHLAEAQAHTDAVIAQLREEADARERRADARIDKLVSAIGEWIRRQSNGSQN